MYIIIVVTNHNVRESCIAWFIQPVEINKVNSQFNKFFYKFNNTHKYMYIYFFMCHFSSLLRQNDKQPWKQILVNDPILNTFKNF